MNRTLGGYFQPAERESIAFTMTLSHEEVLAVAGMGPSARHLDADDLRNAVAALPEPMRVSGSVELATYRRTVPTAARMAPAGPGSAYRGYDFR